FAISLPMTALMRGLGHRLRTLDGPGVAGQVKAASRRVPNTGGVAIFVGLCLPMAVGGAVLALASRQSPDESAVGWLFRLVTGLKTHLPGIAAQTGALLVLVCGLVVLHLMGLIDDRKPLGATPKLFIMLAVAVAVVMLTHSRLLTFLDSRV